MTVPFSATAAFDRDALTAALAAAGFRGEALADPATRAAMSTDNSIYRIIPDFILCPHDEADLLCALAVLADPRFAHLPITARGGGTGTNGQSLNEGVIVDLRRHMTRIIELDAAAGWVEVEPGIVLDDLNAQLAYTGLFFAPTTSTANRCTIGGMVATDASGKGSRIYGKTSDNVLGLRLALDGGRVLDSDTPTLEWAGDRLAEIAAACDAGRGPLLARVPALSRRFTGYDLERARPSADRLEWWRLAIGAEGTLGIVTRVRLKLTPKPRRTTLAVLAFASFDAALAAAPLLLKCDPLAIETIDETVQQLADAAGLLTALPAAIRGDRSLRPVYNIVELAGDEIEASRDRLISILRDLPGLVGHHITDDPAEIGQLWSVRAASVGLLGTAKGSRRPVAFVEDCVVPPVNLPAFVREFTGILRDRGLFYGIYGHIDVGCLHVRPALDIGSDVDRQLLRTISDAVYAAVQRHGGIFWGEHGKGIRGEYLEDFVGAEAYAAFVRIKRAFDPGNRFNPGKLVGAPLRTIDRSPTREAAPVPDDPFGVAFGCNGNAACLTVAPTVAICPSFKATSDVRHSPKGRSEILAAWRKTPGDHEVEASAYEALDGCLGCNACANQCPQQVAIPELKSRFFETYFRKRRRPLADHAALLLERFAPWLVRMRPALALAQRLGIVRAVARMIGLVDLPAFSPGAPSVPRAVLDSLPDDPGIVLLLSDPYTSLFDTQTIDDVASGLSALGYRPYLLPAMPTGKAAHVLGDRRSFFQQARRLAAVLETVGRNHPPIIGIEPSQTLFIRHDYKKNGIAVGAEVLLVQEFLHRRLRSGDRWPSVSIPPAASLLLHCTESAALPGARRQWQDIFGTLGTSLTVPETGCCGMAGLYGHQQRHQTTSRKLFDLGWSRLADQHAPYVTGFSCRCQVERFASSRSRHPLALIQPAIQKGQAES
jgi:FAD/FMN-containing dehydrogenase/Fe-S oxidoreductase